MRIAFTMAPCWRLQFNLSDIQPFRAIHQHRLVCDRGIQRAAASIFDAHARITVVAGYRFDSYHIGTDTSSHSVARSCFFISQNVVCGRLPDKRFPGSHSRAAERNHDH